MVHNFQRRWKYFNSGEEWGKQNTECNSGLKLGGQGIWWLLHKSLHPTSVVFKVILNNIEYVKHEVLIVVSVNSSIFCDMTYNTAFQYEIWAEFLFVLISSEVVRFSRLIFSLTFHWLCMDHNIKAAKFHGASKNIIQPLSYIWEQINIPYPQKTWCSKAVQTQTGGTRFQPRSGHQPFSFSFLPRIILYLGLPWNIHQQLLPTRRSWKYSNFISQALRIHCGWNSIQNIGRETVKYGHKSRGSRN
jgi:hypothetical protein